MLSQCLQTEPLIYWSGWGIYCLQMSHIVRLKPMLWAFLCQKQLGGGGEVSRREVKRTLHGLHV